MTCSCGWNEAREKPPAYPQCGLASRRSTPALCLGWECLQGGGGPVWQQAPIRQLESASACVAICPLRLAPGRLLLATEGPALFHSTRAPSLAGGGGGGAEFHVAFVYSHLFAAPALWSCQDCEKFARRGHGGGFEWGWWEGEVAVPTACSLSLFAQLWPLTPPQVLFFLFFLALICTGTARVGQLSRIWVQPHTTLSQLVKGLKIMGKFSRHLQDMVAVATGLLIW